MDQIYTQFLHINIGVQILYKLLRQFILLRRFIYTQIHVELTIVERQQTIAIHNTCQNSKHENF